MYVSKPTISEAGCVLTERGKFGSSDLVRYLSWDCLLFCTNRRRASCKTCSWEVYAVFASDAPKWVLFLYEQILKYCMLCIVA